MEKTEVISKSQTTHKSEVTFEELLKKNRTTVFDEEGNPHYIVRKIEKPKGKVAYRIIKRAFDLLVGLIGGVVLLIPMIIIALAIKLDSKGPVFYKQERLGYNGKKMTVWKFRSMRVDAEANGVQWASENDVRCTRLGAFLRKCRADELPQIYFNVLPGTMTLIGGKVIIGTTREKSGFSSLSVA